MRRDSVGCKDSSGPVGFDYHELHFLRHQKLGPENVNRESENQKLGPENVNRESEDQKLGPENVNRESENQKLGPENVNRESRNQELWTEPRIFTELCAHPLYTPPFM